MDIASMINQAGGIGAIASQLGIDEATAERGIGALLPHVQSGIETNGLPSAVDAEASVAAPAEADAGGGLGGMLGGLMGGAGESAGGGLGGMLGGLLGGGAGGGLLASIVGGGVGNQILGQIFGSKEGSREVAADASAKSGIDASVLKKLLPIVAGMVAMHYMTKGRAAAPADDAPAEGGGGILGSILGGLTGR